MASHPASHTLWHRRLGHPSSRVVSKLLSDNGISVASCSIDNSVCDACQRGKNCRLPFSLSTRQTSVVFNLIHCDIWGPSPTPTASGFRYYIIFVDDYSRYTWLYPMKAKSDSVDCFKHFKSMGETLFQGLIIA